jgi:peptidoglycan/xylan/chitin deacetylase (PgdA/CDA1 family)
MALSLPAEHPVILTYHSVSEGDSPLKISPTLFAQQMEWLTASENVINVTTLSDLADQWGHLDRLAPRSVILTFDDGYADFYTHAAPVLQKHKLPAIVFLPTAFVGRTNAWSGQPAWVKEEPLMNWQRIKELAEAGIEFGSHTVNHPDLTSLPPAETERELAESKREIEQRTGRRVAHFCYPYGKWNQAVLHASLRHYRSACSTIAGTVRAKDDSSLLPRVDAHYVRDARWFRSMFTRRFDAYIAARRLVRRVRGQPEGGYPS